MREEVEVYVSVRTQSPGSAGSLQNNIPKFVVMQSKKIWEHRWDSDDLATGRRCTRTLTFV